MKASAIMGLRSLASKINGPLPLSSRDSQKLLHLLNASFRQQLDREHPKPSVSEERKIADSHFMSILDSPLFSGPSRKGIPTLKSKASLVEGTSKNVHQSVKVSVDQFRQEVASGSACLLSARQCCVTCMKAIVRLHKGERYEAMASSQVGTNILHWLWSSRQYQTMEFLADERFVRTLLPFLIAERQTSAVWRWLQAPLDRIERSFVESDTIQPAVLHRSSQLMREYIFCQVKHGDGLQAALAEFLRAIYEVSRNSNLAKEWLWTVLEPAGMVLVNSLSRRNPIYKPTPSEYTKLLHSTSIWTPRKKFVDALLTLYHPSRPDPSPAVQYIKAIGSQPWEWNIAGPRKSMIRLCLGTAELLIKTGRNVDAVRIMTFIQDNFTDEVGSRNYPLSTAAQSSNGKVTITETETMNLRLLEGLAFQ